MKEQEVNKYFKLYKQHVIGHETKTLVIILALGFLFLLVPFLVKILLTWKFSFAKSILFSDIFNFYSAIVISIISSVILIIMINIFIRNHLDELLLNTMGDEIKDNISNVLSERNLCLPIKTYEASNSINLELNNDLTHSFKVSQRFIFRGVSGKYAAARILQDLDQLREIGLVLMNPNDKQSLNFEAKERQSDDPYYKDFNMESIKEMVKNDIYCTIVALYKIAQISKNNTIKVAFINHTNSSRLEIFKDWLYFSEVYNKNTIYPLTYKYKLEFHIFDLFVHSCNQYFKISNISFSNTTTIDDLKSILNQVGLSNVDEERLTSYIRDFNNKTKAFWEKINVHNPKLLTENLSS